MFLFLRFVQKIKWRALIQFDECGIGFADIQGCQRASIATKPLKMIERHTQKMGDSQFDRVCMEDNSTDILWFVLLHDSFQGVDVTSLGIDK